MWANSTLTCERDVPRFVYLDDCLIPLHGVQLGHTALSDRSSILGTILQKIAYKSCH